MNDLLTSKDFIAVGYISGLHGYDGSVRINIEPGMEIVFKDNVSFLYFVEDGMFVPRFVRSRNEDQSLISFERIEAREKARHLTDQKVYLRRRDLPETVSEMVTMEREWNLLGGFQIWDVEKDVLLGHIESIEEYPGGWMAEIQQAERPEPLLIPLAEPLIDRIDEENQVLYMKLPDGLVEL